MVAAFFYWPTVGILQRAVYVLTVRAVKAEIRQQLLSSPSAGFHEKCFMIIFVLWPMLKEWPSHGRLYVVKNDPKEGILGSSIKKKNLFKILFWRKENDNYNSSLSSLGVAGVLEPGPAVTRRGEGEGGATPWTSRQLITGPHRETNRRSRSSLTPTDNLEWLDKPRAHVLGLWEEAGEPADPTASLGPFAMALAW